MQEVSVSFDGGNETEPLNDGIESVQEQYVSMRVKNLNYCGKEAISIYIRDRTQAVKEKLYSMKEQEKI